jgi:uncharacterized protein (DUF305 family)
MRWSKVANWHPRGSKPTFERTIAFRMLTRDRSTPLPGACLSTIAAMAVLLCLACGRRTPATTLTPTASPDDGTAEERAIARARADSARYPYTVADVQFMSGMIKHHAQAIVMSRWAPTHDAGPGVLRLASRIINAQQDEIASMQAWLRNRRQPVPEATSGPMKMMMNGMEHEMLMPGMLTDDQMRQLDAARGEAFDRLFLTFMIQHHNGAISMVKDLFATYGAVQDQTVFKFASDVNVDQTTEVTRMRQMLALLALGKRP